MSEPEAVPFEEPGVQVPVVDMPLAEVDPETEAEVEAAFADIETDAPVVGIVMASNADRDLMVLAEHQLEELGILHETRVDDDSEVVSDYARNAKMRGLRVIIAAAGESVALPGVVAANTELPVIGVPLSSGDADGDGLEALSSMPLPDGVPVAWVAPDNARNAALLAARILGR